MNIILFGNGNAQDGSMVQRSLTHLSNPYILCADGGALNAVKFGYTPQTIIGDLDSLTAQQVTDFKAQGATIEQYPPEKDETDLELALHWCIAHDASNIYIIGGLGGRFDQTLANIYLLTLPELEATHIEVVDAEQSIRLLQVGQHNISGNIGDTISLIPISNQVTGITTHNLQYPLNNETLHVGPARGVSNVMTTTTAQISIEAGALLIVHTVGRA